MKHKKTSSDESASTKVYSYAAYLTEADRAKMRDLCFWYNRAYNAFIELERSSTAEYRKARSALSADLAAAELRVRDLTGKLEEYRGEIKRARAIAKERNARGSSTKPDLSHIEKAKAELKEAKETARALRERLKLDPELIAAAERINLNKKLARARIGTELSNVYWQVREIAQESAELAAKASAKAAKEGKHWNRDPEEVGLPGFHRFDGTGRCRVRFTNGAPGGVTLESLTLQDCGSLFRMSKLPPNAFVVRGGKEKPVRSLIKTSAQIRIGSTENREPIWLPLTFVQHRPLPLSSKVTSISLVATEHECLLQFTVSAPPRPSPAKGAKTLRLSVSRKFLPDGGLQVAVADRPGFDVSIPTDIVQAISHSEIIQSDLDKLTSSVLDVLKTAKGSGEIPDEVNGLLDTLSSWKGHSRVIRFSRKLCESILPDAAERWAAWRAHRLSGERLDLFAHRSVVERFFGLSGPQGFAMWLFIAGRKLDHLHLWYTSESSRARGRRKHLFRNYAARLRDELGFGFIEWDQPRELTNRTKPTESERGNLRAVQRMHGIAGASELKSALQNAFSKPCVIIASRTGETPESADDSGCSD